MRGGSQGGGARHWAAALASALMMCTWSKDTAIAPPATPRTQESVHLKTRGKTHFSITSYSFLSFAIRPHNVTFARRKVRRTCGHANVTLRAGRCKDKKF